MRHRSPARQEDTPRSGEEPAEEAQSPSDDDASASRFEDVDLPQYRLQGLTATLVVTIYSAWLYAMMDVWCIPIVWYLWYKALCPPRLL